MCMALEDDEPTLQPTSGNSIKAGTLFTLSLRAGHALAQLLHVCFSAETSSSARLGRIRRRGFWLFGDFFGLVRGGSVLVEIGGKSGLSC